MPSVVALVEVLQHGGVGLLEEPLLAGGGGVTGAHEDPPLAGAAVNAAVADRVVQALVLKHTHTAEEPGHTPRAARISKNPVDR